MSNYDTYRNALDQISKAIGFEFTPMTVAEFDQAEAALQANIPHVHSSVIDMDAFETAFGR